MAASRRGTDTNQDPILDVDAADSGFHDAPPKFAQQYVPKRAPTESLNPAREAAERRDRNRRIRNRAFVAAGAVVGLAVGVDLIGGATVITGVATKVATATAKFIATAATSEITAVVATTAAGAYAGFRRSKIVGDMRAVRKGLGRTWNGLKAMVQPANRATNTQRHAPKAPLPKRIVSYVIGNPIKMLWNNKGKIVLGTLVWGAASIPAHSIKGTPKYSELNATAAATTQDLTTEKAMAWTAVKVINGAEKPFPAVDWVAGKLGYPLAAKATTEPAAAQTAQPASAAKASPSASEAKAQKASRPARGSAAAHMKYNIT